MGKVKLCSQRIRSGTKEPFKTLKGHYYECDVCGMFETSKTALRDLENHEAAICESCRDYVCEACCTLYVLECKLCARLFCRECVEDHKMIECKECNEIFCLRCIGDEQLCEECKDNMKNKG